MGFERVLALSTGALVLAPAIAAADLRVKWDCYLPSTGIDCAVLEASLTSKIPFVRIVGDRRDADVMVTLTSIPAENATRFLFAFVGRALDGYATEVHSTDKIPWSIDPTTASVRIMTRLERGLDDFLDQKVAPEARDGKLTIELLDPVVVPFAGRPEQRSVHWYLAPGLGTYFSDVQGVGINASSNASVFFNYSATAWRLQQWLGASYSQQSQPVPGTDETATIRFEGANASNVLAWSITPDQRWNAGLLVATEKNPQANYRLRSNASVGLEYDLIPRQTVNMRNFGLRCAAGPELEHYDAANTRGIGQQLVAREFCDVFFSWHFAPIDLWASVGENVVLEDVTYRGYSAGLSATWRVTDNLTVAPWVNVQQINQAINAPQPTTAAYTDPRQEIEASMLAAVLQAYTAPFSLQSGLTVRYLFGNGSLASEDQRWKNVSNLR